MPVMSNLRAALENAGAEHAVVEQELRWLENEISSSENELADLKKQHELSDDTFKAEADSRQALQAQCEQLVKANEEISSTITNLSTKIRQEQSSRCEKFTSFQQYVGAALEKVVWTPEALEMYAATLRRQVQELEQHSADLDSQLESKRAELEQLQEQSTNNCSAEDATFGPEEREAILQIFREQQTSDDA